MITPTVGRVVWFYKWNSVTGYEGPLAALVATVKSEEVVNLMVIGAQGVPFSETNTPLVQPGEPLPSMGNYCTWMPYQVGQAQKTKTEELQQKLGAAS